MHSVARRRGDRTFTGCWTCRARKVKCDQVRPSCTPCMKVRRPCQGYESKLVWVTSDNKSYKSHGRRFLRCDLTWAQVPTFDSDQIDLFIALCEAAEHVTNATIEWSRETCIPFSVFPSGEIMNVRSPRVSQSLGYGDPLKNEETFLFRHYVSHVADLMMPYDDKRNPWRSHYPTIAIHSESAEEKVLYKALLAHAALNLAHLGCATERLLLLGARYYTEAMADLRSCLAARTGDYASSIAAILTLMFVEIYGGHSRSWRAHYQGAWSFLESHKAQTPWMWSDFAWVSTQSLCLIKIIGDTSRISKSDKVIIQAQKLDLDQAVLVRSIASGTSFGFTIGATHVLMTCIADIKRLGDKMRDDNSLSLENEIGDLYYRLEECRQNTNRHVTEQTPIAQVAAAQCHLNAFIAATYIYLNRTLFDLAPASLKNYVGEVFMNIRQFYELGGGNFSLWPAFIAAVEAFEDVDLSSAMEWLQSATSVGMANRFKVKAIIEEVWRVRAKTSEISGKPIGSIALDWRDIMQRLDIDVLLV